jgi:predicted RND superfamily exporter protein
MTAASLTADAPFGGYAFNPASGSRLERLVFQNRRVVLVACLLLTLLLGAVAVARLGLNASFDKMIPRGHPYIQNYLQNRGELRGLGNSLRIVVENPKRHGRRPALPGRAQEDPRRTVPHARRRPRLGEVLWAPGVRWTEVTEEGFRGGPVMPDNYDGKPASTEQLRANIARANLVGSLVGTDFRSSMIVLPLLDQAPAGGKRLDYRALSNSIETIRARYEAMGEQAPVRCT